MIRRIIAAILVLASVMIFSSCKPETVFAFKDHHFGDTIEIVQKSEGSNGELDKEELLGYQILRYTEVKFGEFAGEAIYNFKGNKLEIISIQHLILPELWTTNDKGKSIDERLVDKSKKMINILNNTYGNVDLEEKLKYGYKALWKKKNYGITLINSMGDFNIYFSLDPIKAEKFYKTFSFADLLGA